MVRSSAVFNFLKLCSNILKALLRYSFSNAFIKIVGLGWGLCGRLEISVLQVAYLESGV